jgi:hypothetical protein
MFPYITTQIINYTVAPILHIEFKMILKRKEEDRLHTVIGKSRIELNNTFNVAMHLQLMLLSYLVAICDQDSLA